MNMNMNMGTGHVIAAYNSFHITLRMYTRPMPVDSIAFWAELRPTFENMGVQMPHETAYLSLYSSVRLI